MQLFYNHSLSEISDTITFSREESKHIAKVLRKTEGTVLAITNGKGKLFKARLTTANPSKCAAVIESVEQQSKKPYTLHLAVAPTKMNDRYEWFLEKATEIGIDQITPILCDHSERKVIKKERYDRILQGAMKQSLQCYLPKLNTAISFSDFIKKNKDEQCFIAHCEETTKKTLKNELQPGTGITILIGPEGDFSTKEIDLAIQYGYAPVSLAETRLRTETAAIVAAHSVAFVNF
ncbi:16S rRNA (uracil(1498)-N(3))-methyltransferase [Aquimarina sp. U1-2]|uniref:16S rRNA (uracil(1498)-N(3))-methyltransferase n=1 Tax=Aquimarina sp. U1-2 TaxID=2823141 RepID=UPI001AECE73E|nr:16S rRNA (uracil(1498)-N(3))-methyltransferase [Aquimarina sp. U1-2]MBP2832128.1 16S rRNA (uracil(1498)-N(3))-methyltransferase [Aquimarina sp. U1-2]